MTCKLLNYGFKNKKIQDTHKLKIKYLKKKAKKQLSAANNSDLIPTINANRSITVKAIKGSMRTSTNQILIDNHRINNNNIKAVE